MPIKAQYKVVSGDRMSFIAVDFKVGVQEIVTATPDIFTPERIAKSNQLIADGTINPGEMLIFAGEILNIPTGFIDEAGEIQTIKADTEDELTIQIDGKKCPLPHEFTFIEYFDTCSDSFNIIYPHDPEIQDPAYKVDPEDFKTKGLPEIKLFIGPDPVLVGNIEVPANKITINSSTQTLAGRSKTFLLEKSDPLPTIQREFIKQDLKQIATVVCNSYSIGLEITDNVDIGEAFPKATMEDSEKPYSFLGRLSRERSAIVSKTGVGRCLITKAESTEPVANFKINGDFLKFIGVQGLEFTYDTMNLFGQYIGKAQTPDDQNLTETVKSQVLLQQSIKNIDFNDADSITLRSMTEWEEQKQVREFYKNSIPYPDWLNPNTGLRWKTGQIITIESAEAGIIKPQEMLIRQINFNKTSGDKRTATLAFIPVEVYL